MAGNDSIEDSGTAIAVIGMACRFPGAESCEQFWQNLQNGVESISFFSNQELRSAGVSDKLLGSSKYVKARGILKNVDLFDASFFNFSPREAEILDPQHRFFLECAWQALEIAGYDTERYAGLIGVYAGSSFSQYLLNLYSNPPIVDSVGGFQIMVANDKDHLVTRAAYKLNLRGPSVAVQTACSTSLVAVHLACQALLSGDCDIALAGGVSITIPEVSGYFYHEGGILSPDGHCRAFDTNAQGTVNGNGIGIVVLKCLEDALNDGDHIEAVILGSAVTNDGALRLGYTAPGVDGQANVIAAAQAIAGVSPNTIDYIETHGTGTPLGDSVECAALAQAFGSRSQASGKCAIGSVKTNIGHLDASAGVAGFIKTVLALKHKAIPPSLHFSRPGREVNFDGSPFYVNTQLTPWRSAKVRRAAVSSFGLGGTNAHVVLQSAPEIASTSSRRDWHLLLLSAKTSTGLEKMLSNLGVFVERHSEHNLADVAFTLATGRRRFAHRCMLVCRQPHDATAALQGRDLGRLCMSDLDFANSSIVFAFPGLGDHYLNMGLGLYKSEEVFRKSIDLCSSISRPYLGLDLRDILYPERAIKGDSDAPVDYASSQAQPRFDLRKMLSVSRPELSATEKKLNQISFLHPIIFAIEYSLAQLWMSWGIRPAAMVGYSIGELVAACLAKVFSLEDAVSFVSQRARLIQSLPSGAMVAVSCSADAVRPFLGEYSSVSAINGPSMCVVSGPEDVISDLELNLDRAEIVHRRLQASYAFHSDSMAAIGENLVHELRKIKLHPPQIPFVSTLTGNWISNSEAVSIDYWVKHICRPVLFSDALAKVWQKRNVILLEVGPGQGLTSLSLQHPMMDPTAHSAIRSMRSVYEQQADEVVTLEALGKLWLANVEPDWKGFWSGESRRRVPLPTYPFERKRYWIEAQQIDPLAGTSNGASVKKHDPSDWFYVPQWKETSPLPILDPIQLSNSKVRWLLFADTGILGMRLSERLLASDHEVISVTAGFQFERIEDRLYRINPASPSHYLQLLRELHARHMLPERVLHCWSLKEAEENEPWTVRLTRDLDHGFYSLIFLMQAISQLPVEPKLNILAATAPIARVSGNEQLYPAKSPLLASCKVISQEYPNVNCRVIDVLLPGADLLEIDALISQLLAESLLNSGEPEIVYRGQARWTKAYQPVRLEDDQTHRKLLRDGGTYIITGGLGGMGLEFAEYLAQTVRVQLVLIGRSTFPLPSEWDSWLQLHPATDDTSSKIRKLQDILKTGAKVAVFSADVSDEQEMQTVLDKVKVEFGPVHGIIHSAGISGGGIIALKTREAANAVLASKVQGTLVLERLFQNTKLDFFVLCSSLTAILGGSGQVDYCAANMFLDFFAHARRDQVTISVNWDSWREVGMALKHQTSPDPAHGQDERMRGALSPGQGINAFKRILGARYNQVLVSARDIAAVGGQILGGSIGPTSKVKSASAHPRPALGVRYVAPGNTIEETIAQIWQELLGVLKIGMHDSFFHLGGNSLIAVRVISRLRDAFQVEVPLQALLQAITIESLANLIQNILKEAGLESQGKNHRREPPLPVRQNISASPYIIQLQEGLSERPLFLIHPAGGTVFVYRDLAMGLGPYQTVYGIRAQGTAPAEVPLTRIEEMADLYIDAVRTIQPGGPYQLAGLSQGGMIAFEMAQRLHGMGEEISFLGMLDTPGPSQLSARASDDAEMFLHMFGKLLPDPLDYLRQLDQDRLDLYVLEKLQHFVGLDATIGIADARRFLSVWKANMEALQNYAPAVFPGRISFFRAIEWLAPNPEHPELAWISLSGEGIEVFEVPGDHHTMITPPHVSVLAARLRRCLSAIMTDNYNKPRDVLVT